MKKVFSYAKKDMLKKCWRGLTWISATLYKLQLFQVVSSQGMNYEDGISVDNTR